MNDITQGMKFTVDVKSGLVEMPQRAVLMKGDKNANRVTMALYDGEKAVSLEGAVVTGTYVLAGIKMPLLGDADGNEATVILPDECYSDSGRYELRMHVTLGSVKRTFLFITGYVESDGEGSTLDVEGVIPNIDDIIAQYDEMKRVTQETKEAANAANEAASRAPYVGENGNWFVWNAASGSYIDSGSKAQGPTGPQGPAGAEIDNTLTQSGKAADAKVTGDALNQLSQQMADYRTAVNLLDNSGFEVAQAGHMGTHGNGVYLADRWHVAYHPEWLIVAKENEGITLTNSGAGFIEIRQPLSDEAINAIDGKPATLAVCYSDKISVVNFTWSSDTNDYSSGLTSNNSGWYASIFRNNASERVRCRIYSSTAATATIKWVALYEGTYTAETLPPYVSKGYVAELAECRRYAYIPAVNADVYVPWVSADSKTMRLYIDLPVEMHTGSLSFTFGGIGWAIGGGKFVSGDYVSTSLATNSKNQVGINIVYANDKFANDAGVAKVTGDLGIYADL